MYCIVRVISNKSKYNTSFVFVFVVLIFYAVVVVGVFDIYKFHSILFPFVLWILNAVVFCTHYLIEKKSMFCYLFIMMWYLWTRRHICLLCFRVNQSAIQNRECGCDVMAVVWTLLHNYFDRNYVIKSDLWPVCARVHCVCSTSLA